MPQDDPNDKRDQAFLAMAGDKRVSDLGAKRRIARLAMERLDQRQRREAREAAIREKAEMLKQVDEEVKQHKERALQEQHEKELEKQAVEQKKEMELKQKQTSYSRSRETIEKIKKNPILKLRAIHTLQSDLDDTVQNDQLSQTKIAIAAQNKKPTATYQLADNGGGFGRGLLIFMFVILILAGGGLGGYLYWLKRQPTITPVVSTTVPSLIFAEGYKEIDSTKFLPIDLPAQFTNLPAVTNTSGEIITNFNFIKPILATDGKTTIKTTLNFANWLAYSQSAMPTDMARFVHAYMIGVYQGPNQQSPFMVLKIDPYYENIFQIFLNNEGGYVRNLFRNLDGEDVASTTANQKFADYLLKNINTRALKDSTGNVKLVYSFFDRSTLVITKSADALYRLNIVYNTKSQVPTGR